MTPCAPGVYHEQVVGVLEGMQGSVFTFTQVGPLIQDLESPKAMWIMVMPHAQEERKELREKAAEATQAAKDAALAKAEEVKVAATEKLHEKAAEGKEQRAQRVRAWFHRRMPCAMPCLDVCMWTVGCEVLRHRASEEQSAVAALLLHSSVCLQEQEVPSTSYPPRA